MSIRVAYIPHGPQDTEGATWAENTMLINLITNTPPGMEITPCYDAREALFNSDIICLHNLAHTALYRRKWVRGGAWLERKLGHPLPALYKSDFDKLYKLKHRPRIIGGIRGSQGLAKARKYLRYFDAIHTSNKHLAREVLSYGARKAYVLYPGVDLDLFRPRYEMRPDKFTIGWAGDSSKPMKNAHLIGLLHYRKRLATKQFFIPHNEMPYFYNGCDVYTYFSSHEGCNRTILEAMACGLPVVTSDAGEVRDLIAPHWIIPGNPLTPDFMKLFKARVEELRNNPSLRVQVGQDNREAVKPWGWPSIADRLKAIVRDVLEIPISPFSL